MNYEATGSLKSIIQHHTHTHDSQRFSTGVKLQNVVTSELKKIGRRCRNLEVTERTKSQAHVMDKN